jgi:outer membrane receptor protein involved in Fe transport
VPNTPRSAAATARLLLHLFVLAFFIPLPARAAPVEFILPAQRGDTALLAFSKQAGTEVLFSFDELSQVRSSEVRGHYEPEVALTLLLRGTHFTAQRNGRGKFVVRPSEAPTGTIRGILLTPAGLPARGVRVADPEHGLSVITDPQGEYIFTSVPPGRYRLVANGEGFQPLEIPDLKLEAHRVLSVDTQRFVYLSDATELSPFLVQEKMERARPFAHGRNALPPRTAIGNLDLRRSEDDALPFTIYDREQLTRSGVINLNDFLQRELLDSDASTRSPDQDGGQAAFVAGSTNLNLRGYGADETVILVNGRRLPEILTSGSGPIPPDVNLIPLSLVQEIEVLPVSASALYSGNPVGGVINIVLRPDVDARATELTTTYTNGLHGYDAPQSSVSLLHARSLLGGDLRLRFNLTLTRSFPATESELRYHQNRPLQPATPDEPVYRATPNVRSASGEPLFGPGSSSVTSVAPGANGAGGIGAFAGRDGLRNFDFFDSPGGLAASLNSIDYGYGRRQRRQVFYSSAVYDPFPWLQLGLDGTFSGTVANRGFDVVTVDLPVSAASPVNPFGQDVKVSLNEIAPALGEDYSEARVQFYSVVAGALLKPFGDWRVALDAQYAHSTSRYRGLAGADPKRWSQLADDGRYNPFRDTQGVPPPAAFYDEVLVYRGGRGRFVTLGDYQTLDASARVANEDLRLPTGPAVLNLGADYRRNHLDPYLEAPVYSDGTLAGERVQWSGRTLERYSVFGELQAPLVPDRWLPRLIRKAEADLALRYIASGSSNETNFAPTYGLKLTLAGGLIFRGSLTTSNRFPTPQMSRQVLIPSASVGGGVDAVSISDPLRNQRYEIEAREALDPNLRPEAAVTQTAGLVWQGGNKHRLRASIDFLDTRKTNELVPLDAQTIVDLEGLFPERVKRDPLATGDPRAVGRVKTVLIGTTNLAWRHSQNWNAFADYAWKGCLGGTLEFYGRLVFFQRFDRQILPNSPVSDELRDPDATARGVLKYRANFGTSWSNPRYDVGIDAHYFHSRILPQRDWVEQGSDHIEPFLQFDAYVQSDLTRWLPWKKSRVGLRGQLRADNVFDTAFPAYARDLYNTGVQPYGDWRGRMYSVSLTATF